METPNVGTSQSCASSDLADSEIAWLVWRFPAVLLLAGIFWHAARVWLWTPALVVAGVACVFNAARCGRRHCYFTGPLYLLGAAYVVLAEFGLAPMQPLWFLVALVSASLIAQLAELPLGKYVKRA
jgi:predicted small integral membrane protein